MENNQNVNENQEVTEVTAASEETTEVVSESTEATESSEASSEASVESSEGTNSEEASSENTEQAAEAQSEEVQSEEASEAGDPANTEPVVRYTKDSKYPDMVKAAVAFGIAHTGVNKAKLSSMLNDKLNEIGEEEFDKMIGATAAPAASTTAPTPAATPTPTPAASTTPRQPAAPREAAAKWFEGVAQPFEAGQLLDVVGQQILSGRQIKATRPAPGKKDAWKGHLINPKDGSLQNTEVTIDIANLEIAADQVNPKLKAAKVVAAPVVPATPAPTPAAEAAPENPATEEVTADQA